MYIFVRVNISTGTHFILFTDLTVLIGRMQANVTAVLLHKRRICFQMYLMIINEEISKVTVGTREGVKYRVM